MVPSTYKHDRLSALAALPVSPKRRHLGLYTRFQPYHVKASHVAEFLRALLRPLRGPVMVLWDRSSSHQGQAITAIRHVYPRLPLEEVPAYAPELNPTAHVWKDCKGHTSNRLLRDLRDLRRRLLAKTSRVQRSQAKLHACIRASQLPSPP